MTIKDSRGFWNILPALELSMSPKIAKMLEPFSRPVTDCYECGVEVPTLNYKREKALDIHVTGLFLKRILNDLRAIWNLLILGYTSQAGSVAAAAFENALIISCIAGDPHRAQKMLDFKSDRSLWNVKELCKMYMRKSMGENKKSERTSADPEDETLWEVLYTQYMWLCKLKHPNMPSALHDAASISVTEAEYGIMAAPDDRIEDLPSKVFILTVTALRVKEAIDSFALARELDYKHPNVISWKKRFDSIVTNLDKAVDPIMKMPLPFDYKGHMFKKE